MPPWSGSRYAFCRGVRDDAGRLALTEREPYPYREHPDMRVHVVAQGDTWFALAGRYFEPLPRACGYWWAICDFQPDPVVDPTLELSLGSRVFIPSVRVLTDVILAESRRREVS
ncbi:MAG: hypothetical protein IPI49_19805 [Myxococcales bacterium]|nr:hypothetical protein [Myxococcales bacterium]